MENASKALILAASFLVGLIVISIMVVLFSSFGNTGTQIMQSIENTKIGEWNNNFLKYVGTNSTTVNGQQVELPIYLTAYDIISLANKARQANIDNELDVQDLDRDTGDIAEDGSLYIEINIVNSRGEIYRNLSANGTQFNTNNIEKRIGPNSTNVDGETFKRNFLIAFSQMEATRTGQNTTIQVTRLYKVLGEPTFNNNGRVNQIQFTEYDEDEYVSFYQNIQNIAGFQIPRDTIFLN